MPAREISELYRIVGVSCMIRGQHPDIVVKACRVSIAA